MKTDELIIKLLVEDLKFHQVTLALRPLELSHEYSLDLISLVIELMMSNRTPSDYWLNTYTDFMNRADECHFWNDKDLTLMATKCYLELKKV